MQRASHVFACCERDQRRFGELYGVTKDRVSVIPNGIDLATADTPGAGHADGPRPTRARSSLPRRALFTGGAVVHNHAAVRALLTRVAPALEREVEFVIVGACARRFRRHRAPNVVLDPDGDISQYVRPGTIGLNSVEKGSGTSLKLLHYLAHGLPVLSTPFGLRGFEEFSPWVTTANLDAFPDTLRRELPAPHGLREKLARYEWHRIAGEALGIYEGLAATRPNR